MSVSFREITRVRQREGEPKRRWFADHSMDLYIWEGESGEVLRFQVTYDKPHNEKALTWRSDSGFACSNVDDGEHDRGGHAKATPLLMSSDQCDQNVVLKLLAERRDGMPQVLYDFVCDALKQ